MKKTKTLFVFVLSLSVFLISFLIVKHLDRPHEMEAGHALDAFEFWYNQRALPYETIPNGAFLRAAQYVKRSMMKERSLGGVMADSTSWISIGPDNVGGRTLSIAVNPDTPSVVWIGSSSGGLWKSTTAGVGWTAWTLINTGYPTLAVSSIALDQNNTNTMYIGTGEIGAGYKYRQIGTPGARSTYGMGVLKSTDGGATWLLTGLSFTFPEVTAVQKVVINPLNPNTVYAATSEGTYKTTDGGETWTVIHTVLMAMDMVINPVDTTILYVACGQRNTTTNAGIYKSTDAGATWSQLFGSLPTSNAGRTSLAISQSNPEILCAAISNATSSSLLGLYRTTNGGVTWFFLPAPNFVGNQGWYDIVVQVHPTNPNIILCSGLDVYRSINGGSAWTQESFWYLGYPGPIVPGGSEGPPDYAHADHHAITFDPVNPNVVYFGTDGGFFASSDTGATFEGRNGGYVTTQFYNGFANADNDSAIAIGGLQDNGTVKYEGYNSWSKVVGGDGGWCAIDPTNKDILYEEYVYLSLAKSTDGGWTWFSITRGILGGGFANFIAPFAISHSNPNVLYAGGMTVYKTTDGGGFWDPTTGAFDLNGTALASIGISYLNPDTVICGTGGASTGTPALQIFRTTNGGITWTNVTGTLPNRYPTDISFDPNSSLIAYLTYSGYGTPHVFKTTDAGLTWEDISSNLPDIPTQSVVVDPAYPDHIFVGTDLGVFTTVDGGVNWYEYNTGMPPAMVTDLGISRTNRVLRASTHGSGVFQRRLPPVIATRSVSVASGWNLISLPVDLTEKRDSLVFPTSISHAFAYEAGYARKDTLAMGIGYWKKFAAGESISLTGSQMIGKSINVSKGWNLIGSISDSVAVSSVTTDPLGIIASNVYGYDNGYFAASSIAPAHGYWVKVNANGILTMNSPGKIVPKVVPHSKLESSMSKLLIEDAEGKKQKLFFGKQLPDEHSLDFYEFPPLPPTGIFDARFRTGRMVEVASENSIQEIPIQISSATYPLTVQWNTLGNFDAELVVDGKATAIQGVGSVNVEHRTSNIVLRLSSSSGSLVPQQFALRQNYPNPFNPTTRIRFDIPAVGYNENRPSVVQLEVFDMLGRHVATLVNEAKLPGVYEVEWNAANLPSGIYYSRMSVVEANRAPLFQQTRKMLLMK